MIQGVHKKEDNTPKVQKHERIRGPLPARLVFWTVSQTITEQFINEDAERNWIHA